MSTRTVEISIYVPTDFDIANFEMVYVKTQLFINKEIFVILATLSAS